MGEVFKNIVITRDNGMVELRVHHRGGAAKWAIWGGLHKELDEAIYGALCSMSRRLSGAYRTRHEVATSGQSRCGAYGLAYGYGRLRNALQGMGALAWWHGKKTAIRCFR